MPPSELIEVDRSDSGHVNRWIGGKKSTRQRHAVAIRWGDGTLLVQIKGGDGGDGGNLSSRQASMVLSRDEMIALGMALIQTATEKPDES